MISSNFSQCSGILEWCNNTIPIGTYLKSAHERYYPNDMKPQECFLEVTNFDKLTDEGRREKFLNICDKIHPVFHNFFYENYKSPGQLFERRLAYTNSVAVSSMVGYVLGIGDRHVQNILIDYNTAEVCMFAITILLLFKQVYIRRFVTLILELLLSKEKFCRIRK